MFTLESYHLYTKSDNMPKGFDTLDRLAKNKLGQNSPMKRYMFSESYMQFYQAPALGGWRICSLLQNVRARNFYPVTKTRINLSY